MERIIEPELMEDLEQVGAYTAADFAQSHQLRVAWFQERFGVGANCPTVLDLGCGSGDMTLRFARALPAGRIVAVDGSQAMLDAAARLCADDPQPARRIQWLRATLPGDPLPAGPYSLVMSHSALHHFHDPQALWRVIREQSGPGTIVFVSDLLRAESVAAAQRIVEERAGDEHPALKRDFAASLCAAFTADEVRAQLELAGLQSLRVETPGDFYLLVSGIV